MIWKPHHVALQIGCGATFPIPGQSRQRLVPPLSGHRKYFVCRRRNGALRRVPCAKALSEFATPFPGLRRDSRPPERGIGKNDWPEPDTAMRPSDWRSGRLIWHPRTPDGSDVRFGRKVSARMVSPSFNNCESTLAFQENGAESDRASHIPSRGGDEIEGAFGARLIDQDSRIASGIVSPGARANWTAQ